MTTIDTYIARIDEYAAQLKPRRALVGAITLPFWVLGYTIGALARLAWICGVYVWSAAAVGYETGLRRRPPE